MNEKGIIIFIISIMLAIICTGCVSQPRFDTTVLEYQRQIDSLESRISSYEQSTDYAIRELEIVTSRAKSVEGTIDELISLFDEYQRTIERILYNYRAAESKAENKNTDSNTVTSNINN